MTSENQGIRDVEDVAQVNLELDRRLQQLNTLFDIGKGLNARFEREPILDLLLLTLLGQMAVSRAAVFLKDKQGLRFAAGRGCSGPVDLGDAASGLEALEGPVRGGDASGPVQRWMEAQKFSTVVPMHLRGEMQGLICLGRRPAGRGVGTEQDEFLLTLGNLAIAALDNARLFAERLAARRLEAEMQLAQSIQTRLLPRELPVSPIFDIAAVSVSSREVGGDYYDAVELADGDLRIAIGDVSGKGVPAALLMANVQAGYRVLRDEPDEAALMARINRVIHENTDLPRFITFVTARLHVQKAELRYVNAGHNPPYLLRASGAVRTLTEGGLILGIFADSAYESESVAFESGDVLVLFTDGITEAMDADDQEFGEERLLQVLVEARELPAAEILARVRAAVDVFAAGAPQRDDLTLLVVRRR